MGLVIVGLVLATTIVRTGSLWSCIGLHAGWFLVRKLAIRGLDLHSQAGHDSSEPSWLFLTMPWTWLAIAVAGAIVLVLAPRIATRAEADRTETKREDETQEGPEGKARRASRRARGGELALDPGDAALSRARGERARPRARE